MRKRPRTTTPDAIEDSDEDELYFVHTRRKSRVESEKVVFVGNSNEDDIPRKSHRGVSIYQKVAVKRQSMYQTKCFRAITSRASIIDDSDGEPQIDKSWPLKEVYVELLSDSESDEFKIDTLEISSDLFNDPTRPFPDKSGRLSDPLARKLHLNQRVLQHLVEPKATRLVGAMAGGLFNRNITIVEHDDAASPIDITCEPAKAAHRRRDSWKLRDHKGSRNIRFIGGPIWADAGEGTIGYGSCTIDDTIYRPGDFVLMRPSISASTSTSYRCLRFLMLTTSRGQENEKQTKLQCARR
jgi:hypothetical protein